MGSHPLAELCAVAKDYGSTRALDGVSFEVRAGEVLGLVGQNGAGKTTALRILVGLLEASAGSAWIDGRDVAREPLECRRLVSFVPDGAPLYANLSPRRHLELVGRLHGLDEARIREEGSRLLAAFELAERGDDPVGSFSRGMRQKTALSCALIARPKLLILDEPLEGLDAPTTAMVKELLREWARRGGAVFYTSHLLDVVERVCDRIVVLAGGRVAAAGALDELRTQSGSSGTLEQVFQTLTRAADPLLAARRALG